MREKIKVAIVEDNEDLREGIYFIINNSEEYICAHQFSNAEDALENISNKNTDVVLMDIGLPGMSGIDLALLLKEKFPVIQVIMSTVFEDYEKIFKALEAGATGYILKKTPPEELLQAIKDVYNGGSPMSGEIARKVVTSFQFKRSFRGEIDSLTKREKELLNLLATGYRYKEIAEKLFISIDTVRSHIRKIYEKLQVQSKVEALNKLYKSSS